MLVFLLQFSLIGSSFRLSYAETIKLTDVDRSHWSYKILETMVNEGIIPNSDKFGLGDQVTESNLIAVLDKIIKNDNYVLIFEVGHKLTRKEALTVIFNWLSIGKISNQLGELKSPFIDGLEKDTILNLSSRFGWISVNASKTYRPNQLIKKEEAMALLYNVNKSLDSSLSMLHSYYAISSYSQVDLSKQLDSLSFGWARLEFDKNKENVILNMTSSNSNEYRVPTGYSSALESTNHENLTKQLMIFVKDENSIDPTTGKSVSLAESILKSTELSSKVIASIIDAVTQNAYKIPFQGVLIDFEGLKGKENATLYNNFVKMLNEKLEPLNLTLYIAVHPERVDTLSYFDGYDFKTLGEYADYMILMAHDYYAKKLSTTEMQLGFTVTPLSPINEVYYALNAITDPKSGVSDPKKVLLQFSFDTAQWKLDNNQIINSTPYHPTYSTIADKIDSGASIKYSEALQSSYIEFFDNTVKNIIWYEDERSIQAKIDIAKYFGIGGISLWRLGTIPEFESETNIYMNVWSKILSNFKAK
ncbi:glycosyl hydrolase family 18 protein [Fusibacter bizertensis]